MSQPYGEVCLGTELQLLGCLWLLLPQTALKQKNGGAQGGGLQFLATFPFTYFEALCAFGDEHNLIWQHSRKRRLGLPKQFPA